MRKRNSAPPPRIFCVNQYSAEKYRGGGIKESKARMTSRLDKRHWDELQSFMLWEGVCLQRGHLPGEYPGAADTFTYNEKLIYQDTDFALVLASLRADKKTGKEWQDIGDWEAAHKTIARDAFLKHWKECVVKNSKKAGDVEKELTPRERNSILKMLICIAIKKYGYKPLPEVRSPAVTKIKRDMEEIGMPVDEGTILKFLREGSELIPLEFRNNSRSD
jgi:hypothetical protein